MSFRAVLKHFYSRVPGLRELRQVRELLIRQGEENAALRIGQQIALEDALRAHPRYGDARRLHSSGFRSFSQNEEDGMIAEVFRRIGTGTRTFVEIGVGDGLENNSRLLLQTGWTGWWFEGSPRSAAAIRRHFSTELAEGRLCLVEAMLSPASAAGVLATAGVPPEPDLLSIDVDQHTFHLWAALSYLRPRLIVVEYNAVFPPPIEWVARADSPAWSGSRDFGASLSSIERLARTRGYALVGCDLTGINAFLVRSDLLGGGFLAPYDAATHYEPPRYGAKGHGSRAWDSSMKPIFDGLT